LLIRFNAIRAVFYEEVWLDHWPPVDNDLQKRARASFFHENESPARLVSVNIKISAKQKPGKTARRNVLD
jgi:hypothetical protein